MYTHLNDKELLAQLTLLDNLTQLEVELVDRLEARIAANEDEVDHYKTWVKATTESLIAAQETVIELQAIVDGWKVDTK